jgi:RNA polymerase sigma factor (sigma-70 family)
MKNLNELVKEYKNKKNNQVFELILKILKKDIEKKSEMVYQKLKCYQIEKEDIKQELYIRILNIIESYDPKEPFENYLFSSLKFWMPKLVKEDIINYESLYKTDEETGEEVVIDIEDKNEENICSSLTLEDIFRVCKTKEEKAVCKLLLNNPNISQEEIAKELKTYQMNISRIINELRERLKRF